MDSATLRAITELLSASGSYGIACIMGWGLWRINEKKDKELKEIYNRLIVLSEQQASATAKVGAALVALKEAIAGLR